jgi:hypothetical protein
MERRCHLFVPLPLITGFVAVQYDLAQKGTPLLGHAIKPYFLSLQFTNKIKLCISSQPMRN